MSTTAASLLEKRISELETKLAQNDYSSQTRTRFRRELSQYRAALDALRSVIEAASRHIHACDHPVNDNLDHVRQKKTLRDLSSSLARLGGM